MDKLPAWARRFVDNWETQQLEQLRKSEVGRSLVIRHPDDMNSSNITQFASVIPDTDRLFKKCPETTSQAHVPSGTITQHKNWDQSIVYPGTMRDFDVYVPPGTQPGETLGLIFIADGKAAWQFATKFSVVLDNMIHENRIPRCVLVLAGVGWEPATGATRMEEKQMFPTGMPGYLQRWRELDVCSEEYGQMVVEEMLPWIEQEHNITFTKDPSLRCMGGQSSGGLCAFNVAWTRPEDFGLIFGVSTSFPNCMPGYLLPKEVRRERKKNLRVALLVGEFDTNNKDGCWCEHTELMRSALNFKGYENLVEVAKGGGHTLRYAGMRMAHVLEWLFVHSVSKAKL